MRWKRPAQGEGRTKTAFLFFPKEIGGETRWLQKATWLEEVMYYGPRDVQKITHWEWVAVRWLDD